MLGQKYKRTISYALVFLCLVLGVIGLAAFGVDRFYLYRYR